MLAGIGSVIGGIGSVLGSGIFGGRKSHDNGAGGALFQTLFQNQLQRDNTKWLIDYQNDYNKPIKQMKRLKEAGLNPNLMYGSISPSMSAGGTMSAPSIDYSPSYKKESRTTTFNRAFKGIGETLQGLNLLQNAKAGELNNEGTDIENDIKKEILKGKRIENNLKRQKYKINDADYANNAEIEELKKQIERYKNVLDKNYNSDNSIKIYDNYTKKLKRAKEKLSLLLNKNPKNNKLKINTPIGGFETTY